MQEAIVVSGFRNCRPRQGLLSSGFFNDSGFKVTGGNLYTVWLLMVKGPNPNRETYIEIPPCLV